MTQPSRPSPATEGTVTESQGPPDQTVPRADTLAAEAPPANPDAPNFAPPQHAGEVGKLGRYRVLKELGRGGMGAVYLGYDGALDRKVALKVMLPNHAANRDARERFLREARTAAMVKSDHVVTIFDVAEERGIPFIAMQYLLGYPLDQYLKTRGELPLVHVLRVGRETALGLAAAHELGLIHRDIKPANLWLEAPKGRVKLLDFGLARAENDDVHLTNTGAVVGTPAYMSPEQGRGEKVDHRTDLFSLGVLLYRLATGRMPFRGANTMAILTSLAVDTPAPVRQLNPAVPEALEAIIDRLLAKNPDERIQTAMEVVVALRDIEHPKSASGPLPVVVPLQPLPMAIIAQTQNVWEGIDDSESVPVPLATSAETEADPAPAPKPPRKQPERKASKLPLILAGVGLLAAVAVLISVMGPKRTNPPVVPNTEPDEKRPPTLDKKQTLPAIDPDRRAAEYVLSIGGYVRVNGGEKWLATKAVLPTERFTLTGVSIERRKERLTAEELAYLKDCRDLSHLSLWDTPVDEAGMVAFKGHKNLTYLNLLSTEVGSGGLANFKDCTNLSVLALGGDKLTDDAFSHFKDCKKLTNLYLGGPQVTDAALMHFTGCVKLTSLELPYVSARDTGFAAFKDCKELMILRLTSSLIGDGGLAYFKDCKKLTELHLFGARQVTDGGLAHLKDSKQLTVLGLEGTKVTLPAIEAFHKALPQCKIVHDKGTIEAKDIEREVTAELLGRAGGTSLHLILPGEKEVRVRKLAEIPPGPFALDGINIYTPFSEADLKRLEHLRRLRVINLLRGHSISAEGLRSVLAHKSTLDWLRLDYAPVSDEGLKVVGQLPELSLLGLNDTKVTNDGLKHLTGLKKLRQLELENAPVTDAAIDTLAEMKSLVVLNVTGTKLTEPGFKKLAEKLPGCKITHDKGVIEPTAVGDPDRKAAEYVLSIGGRVRVNAEKRDIKATADLPKDRFALTYILFDRKKLPTDADLVIFKDCKNITELIMPCKTVTDAGFANFQNCTGLQVLVVYDTQLSDKGLALFKDREMRYLHLGGTQVTNEGLALFKDCKALGDLNLYNTQITDAGLEPFKKGNLRTLTLTKVKVTEGMVAEFAKANPECRITLDDRVIEPKKK